MRINVYSQELTHEVGLVKATGTNGREYYGVRMYLRSPKELHNIPGDDDRSAITLWLPTSEERRTVIAQALRLLAEGMQDPEGALKGNWLELIDR